MSPPLDDGLDFSGYPQPPDSISSPGGSYVLPIASTTTLGGIKTDGVTTMTDPVTGVLTTIARLG
jgi:hypothetical protein